MSATLSLLSDPGTHLAAVQHSGQLMAAEGGILDWVNSKALTANKTIQNVGLVIVGIVVVLLIWQSKGGLAGVVMALVVGGLAVYVVTHTNGTSPLQDKVNKELSTRGAPVSGPITHLPQLEGPPATWHQVA